VQLVNLITIIEQLDKHSILPKIIQKSDNCHEFSFLYFIIEQLLDFVK